ncbi:hypothetical protein CEP45_05010 [Mergibacter septicus]|uniref:imelysin family protein n=1 Tax=Mergibacter septicus TaxID=221402 RepID=UPI001C789B9D|nr:imelysin family protein [Mergibacter septicus]QDJ13248.1 hypothetical protein CEP45_05010 [Mergibacter septicus]
MKKILISLGLISLVLFLIFMKNPHTQQEEALAAMYDNVIIKNAENAVAQCTRWQQTLNETSLGQRQPNLDNAFSHLVLAWKAVEATYIAGDLDQMAIDYPRYLDIFHTGNESITQQMQKVIKSNSKAQYALYKHSYKTINALEAILYMEDQLTERKLALTKEISHNICERLSDINHIYQTKRSEFLSNRNNALSMLVNVLANQTLVLKDWRIGDVAGLTKKYLSQPDAKRSEYYLSHLSLAAIKTILNTQKQLIEKQTYPNFVEIAEIYSAQKQLEKVQQDLSQAENEITKLEKEPLHFSQQPQINTLYQIISRLQSGYYNNLIHALPVTTKILEADGD